MCSITSGSAFVLLDAHYKRKNDITIKFLILSRSHGTHTHQIWYQNIPAICTFGSAVWLSRTPLICFQIVEMHVPDRVLLNLECCSTYQTQLRLLNVLQCRVKLINIGLRTMVSTLRNGRTGSSLLLSTRKQGLQILLMQGIVT
jgi:hypothetical protein